MKTLVLDASAIMGLVLTASDPAYARAIAEVVRTSGGCAPALFWFEVRNVLAVAERLGRVDRATRSGFLASLAQAPIMIDDQPDEVACFDLAARHQPSFYDAVYLELAARRGLPIATLDRALARGAQAAGVPVFTPSDA